jgi:hypothetical protein
MERERMRRVSIVLVLVCGLMFSACSKPGAVDPKAASPADSKPSSPPASGSDNKAATQEQGPVVKDSLGLPVQKPGGPGKLLGSYTIAEVHEKGVVTMIPHQISTQFTFLPDGTYSRTSKARDKANFKDSGQFAIEGEDQLVLKIVMWRGKIQQPPVVKRHKFSLSEDGMELKMIAKDGKVAVFRR